MTQNLKHTVTLYIAPRIENAVLSSFEGDSIKIYCQPEEMVFSTKDEVTEKSFREVMDRSKKAFENKEDDFWIAAIKYMDNFFKQNKQSIIVV